MNAQHFKHWKLQAPMAVLNVSVFFFVCVGSTHLIRMVCRALNYAGYFDTGILLVSFCTARWEFINTIDSTCHSSGWFHYAALLSLAALTTTTQSTPLCRIRVRIMEIILESGNVGHTNSSSSTKTVVVL